MRYIKPYTGPSRTWFLYQNSLSEGCDRLGGIVSELPVDVRTAKLIVDMLLRLDDKLCSGGVDDSDGTVGLFIEDTVQVLKEFVRLDPACVKSFSVLRDRETCFGWEEPPRGLKIRSMSWKARSSLRAGSSHPTNTC